MANTDAPTADVPVIGISEITTIITLIGAVLSLLFGKDWGVAASAEQYAGVAVVLLPIGLALSRAIKHHGAAHANAAVYIAQLAAAADALAHKSPDVTPEAVAAGVSALNANTTNPAPDDAEGDAAP